MLSLLHRCFRCSGERFDFFNCLCTLTTNVNCGELWHDLKKYISITTLQKWRGSSLSWGPMLSGGPWQMFALSSKNSFRRHCIWSTFNYCFPSSVLGPCELKVASLLGTAIRLTHISNSLYYFLAFLVAKNLSQGYMQLWRWLTLTVMLNLWELCSTCQHHCAKIVPNHKAMYYS